MVAPLAGAWIEIDRKQLERYLAIVAPLAGAWIEILIINKLEQNENSRSPRGSVD